MKIKHPFALLAPLVFLFLAACLDVTRVEIKIPCVGPPPFVMDTLNYNGACPYIVPDGDTTRLVMPGVVG